MDQLRVSIINNDDYDSFVILDPEAFFRNIKNDLRIAQKFKDMDLNSFIQWIDKGITPKQYKKLQELNCFY